MSKIYMNHLLQCKTICLAGFFFFFFQNRGYQVENELWFWRSETNKYLNPHNIFKYTTHFKIIRNATQNLPHWKLLL